MSEDYNIHIINVLEKLTKMISVINDNKCNITRNVYYITNEIEKAKKELFNNISDGK